MQLAGQVASASLPLTSTSPVCVLTSWPQPGDPLHLVRREGEVRGYGVSVFTPSSRIIDLELSLGSESNTPEHLNSCA